LRRYAVRRSFDRRWTASAPRICRASSTSSSRRTHAGERPFTVESLKALGRLVPSERLGYTEIDRIERRILEYVGTDQEDDDGGVVRFSDIVDEHPLRHYQLAYLDFSAKRVSDVISYRRLRRTRVYAEWFQPFCLAGDLEAGILRSRARTHNFVLNRADRDFSTRDRAVLELVRPHLARIHEHAALRSGLSITLPDLERLTSREAEVLELVGRGLTNGAIAERLWVSPGTVKKHLDNIYAKLGVTNRTAAASRLGRRSG
jgi:DNA-binding CsgD family transcriptional regulator